MNKTGLAALVLGASMAIGCHVPKRPNKVYIAENSCKEVKECGIVCYETLDSGKQIITIGGQEYGKADVMVNCKLNSLCAKENVLILIKQ
ncbi:MAG: hypothetical protein V1734_06375 [Nanoarchaeota archaeon]